MMDTIIYLDYNATTPVDPQVALAMEPYLREHFGNPSSTHSYGAEARMAVEAARKQVAGLLGAEPWEIIFTSGGTESNNLAIQGAARALKERGNHIITSQVEHPAVLEVCSYLEAEGFKVTYLPVDHTGWADPDSVKKAIRPGTILISVMHANNEVGTIQPIESIAAIARENNILFHTDAAQSTGKIPVKVNDLGVDLLSVAGHKLYGPKGVGALYIRQGTRLAKVIYGADHEQNRRPGTENVLEIVGLGKACEVAGEQIGKNAGRMKTLRNRLQTTLLDELPNAVVNGHPEKRLPNTLSISFPTIEAQTLLGSMERLAASAGAACHADQVMASSVLQAMQIEDKFAMGTVRLSLGKMTTREEVDEAAGMIVEAVKTLSGDPAKKPSTVEAIKLTHFTHGLGCACKLRPQDLELVLRDLPAGDDPRILVGPETADDAAVFKLRDDLALVKTVDFFTPIVDDPYQFGAIAASNALSDIYAMGAHPLFALNIVGFPVKRLDLSVLKEILRGAHDKAKEAGISVLGGHTIEDTEPKYGMVVTGEVHPQKIWSNHGARPGDQIILTKPIGTGVMSTALKRGILTTDQEDRLIEVMSRLNRDAADILFDYSPHACTDVTGFGLLGHLLEMSRSSQVDVTVAPGQVPLLTGLMELIASGIIPGGTRSNIEYLKPWINEVQEIPDNVMAMLCDAQTSGGLLIALPEKEAGLYIKHLRDGKNIEASSIGRFTAPGTGRITVAKSERK